MEFLRSLRQLWRHRYFRRLLAVRVATQSSDGVLQIALASYVLFSPERQPDAAAIAAVLVPEVRAPFAAGTGELLPAGSTVTLLPERFLAVEPALGSVPMLVCGDEPGNFLVVVSHVEGRWLVASTEPVQ